MPLGNQVMCADCAGFDVEWMRQCHKHKGVQFCRGCSCPHCVEEAWGDYEEDGPMDLEDQLENALDRAGVGKSE